jgi:hypothetical protein
MPTKLKGTLKGKPAESREAGNHSRQDQTRLEPEIKHQEMMDGWILDMKDGQKERLVCREATEAKPEKMEPNPGEKEVVVERQIPNEEALFH